MARSQKKEPAGGARKPHDVNPRTLVAAVGARLAAGREVVAAHAPKLRRRLAIAVAGTTTLATIGLTLPTPTGGPAHEVGEHLALTRVSASAESSTIVGSSRPGLAGAEKTALLLANRVGGIPVDPSIAAAGNLLDRRSGTSGTCPPMRLRVSWEKPLDGYKIGAYVAPLGPAPTAATTNVNGIVLCEGSAYAYLGFEETWTGAHWTVIPVPSLGADEHARSATDDTAPGLDPAQTPDLGATNPIPTAAGGAWGQDIEPLAGYQPQATCDPVAKPGVVGFRDLLLRSFPGSRDL